jgi:hypothetical protein
MYIERDSDDVQLRSSGAVNKDKIVYNDITRKFRGKYIDID